LTGAANARLAVFVGDHSRGLLLPHLSGSIWRVCCSGRTIYQMGKHKNVASAVFDYSNETPSFFPSVQITLQCRVPASPSIAN
jgi:hypothetical protein